MSQAQHEWPLCKCQLHYSGKASPGLACFLKKSQTFTMPRLPLIPHLPCTGHLPASSPTALWKACSPESSSGVDSLLVLCPRRSPPARRRALSQRPAQPRGGLQQSHPGEAMLRTCVRGYCGALVWGLLMRVDEKTPGHGTFFIRLHAILSALHAFSLLHIYVGLLMPTYLIAGNVNAPSLSYAVG